MGSQTVHAERLQFGGPGQLWAAPDLTQDDTYAPVATAGKFTVGTAAGDVPGDAAWLPLGDLGSAVSIDYAITVEEINVENSYEVVANMVTKRVLSIKAELVDMNMTNYALVMNAGLPGGGWTGTPDATTGVAKFTPPALGNEQKVQLMWVSNDNTDLILVYRALQTGSVTEKKGKGAAGRSSWSLDFKGEMPDSALAGTLFNRWRSGPGAAPTLSTDV